MSTSSAAEVDASDKAVRDYEDQSALLKRSGSKARAPKPGEEIDKGVVFASSLMSETRAKTNQFVTDHTRCADYRDTDYITKACLSQFIDGTKMYASDYGRYVRIELDNQNYAYEIRTQNASNSISFDGFMVEQNSTKCPDWQGHKGFVGLTSSGEWCFWNGAGVVFYYPHGDVGTTWYLKAWVTFAPGAGRMEVLSDPYEVLPVTLEAAIGNQQSAPVGQLIRYPIEVLVRNPAGEMVEFPIVPQNPNYEFPIRLTLKPPRSSSGGEVTKPNGDSLQGLSNYQGTIYPDPSSDRASFKIRLGGDAGKYDVEMTSLESGSPLFMASATASAKVEPPEQQEEQAEDAGEPESPGDTEGDPISIASGNNLRREVDYAQTGLSPLKFERFYSSKGAKSGQTKTAWSTSYDARVVTPSAAGAPAFVRRPDGRSIRFIPVSGAWATDSFQRASLTQSGNTWIFTEADGTREVFDSTGKLQNITDLRGRVQTITYDRKGKLGRVATNTGEALDFTYDGYGQLATVKDHTARTWSYTYDTWGNLVSTTYPGGVVRLYEYADQSQPHLLTGVQMSTQVGSVGWPYVKWTYDAEGRATGSWFNDDYQLRKISVSYGSDGSRTVTDRDGKSATYQTVRSGNRTFVSNRSGAQLTNVGSGHVDRQFDAAMNVSRSVKNGLATEFFNYDAKGQPAYRVSAAGTPQAKRADFTFDPRFIGKLTSIIEPSVKAGQSRVTNIQYDAMGNPTRISVAGYTPDGAQVSQVTSMQYAGPFGQISQIDGPRTDVADITRFEYDATSKRLARVIDPNGIVTREAITWSKTGKITAETRPNGLRILYGYDTSTDLLTSLRETAAGIDRQTTWNYTNRRQVKSITFNDGVNPKQAIYFSYNAAGDVTKTSSTSLAYGSTETTQQFDNLGNEVGYAAAGRWTQRIMDQYNRVDRLVRANNEIDFDFAEDGHIEKLVDGKSQATTFSYDDLRRLTQIVEPGAAVTTFGYDVHNRLTSVTAANGATTGYVYDDLGNLLSLNSPDTGGTVFVHDAAGNVIRATDAQARVTTYAYDAGNRIKSANRTGTAEDDVFAYDTCANGRGRLCGISRGNGENVSFEYDGAGRITRQANAVGSISYEYAGSGQVTKVTYPSGRSILYSYDDAGRLVNVRLIDGSLSSMLADNVKHLGRAPITGWTYGNGLAHSRSYDMQLWPRSVTSGSASQQSLIAFDGNGNPTAISVDNVARTYGYNARDELTSATGPWGTQGYQYDVVGNRTQFTDDGVSSDYLYEAQSNRIDLSTPWDYTLDASGSMTHKMRPDGSGYRFVFNAENRLVEARNLQTDALIATYAYNALGQRVAKTIGGNTTRFVYGLDGKLLAEVSSTGVVQREYVWLNDMPLAVLGVPDGASPAPVTFDQVVDNLPATSFPACMYWTKKRDSLAEGGDYLIMGTGSNACNSGYTWTAALPVQGIYDVYVKWMGTQTTLSTDFNVDGEPISIENAGKVKGSWVKLKTLAHGPGALNVKKNVYYGANQHWADAMRVVLVGQDAQDHSRVAYIHADHLGTPLAMTDKNQRVIWRGEHEPFGSAVVNVDPDTDGQHTSLNLRFSGQYFDAETGLHYNYFRDYDPELGRYIESDPMGLEAGVNTYGYVSGNPITQVDSLGLWASQKFRYVHQWAWQNTVGRGQNLGVNMVIENALAFADEPQFQDAAHSHQHAMRSDPHQSVASAEAATAAFIRSQYDRAWALMDAGDRNAALHEFGIALHALQDATSPAHEGFQVWTGEETRWEQAQHVRQEIFDPGVGSALYEITEEAWNALNERRYPDKPW